MGKLMVVDIDKLGTSFCHEIMNDDCENCPLTGKCHHGFNPLEEIAIDERSSIYADELNKEILTKEVVSKLPNVNDLATYICGYIAQEQNKYREEL